MKRSLVAIALAAVLFPPGPIGAASLRATVTTTVDQSGGDTDKEPAPSKNAGTIIGHVTAISYAASTMTVAAKSRHVVVHVLPSTSIEGPGNAFHTIADIKKRAHVRVLLSQSGSTYNAQLITLLSQ